MADISLPSPWPGTYTAPAIDQRMVAQGVLHGTSSSTEAAAFGSALNEIPQIKKGLVWFNPSIAPFLRVSSKLKGSRSVESARFYHLEKQSFPRTVQVASVAGADADTTPDHITFDSGHGARLRVNDLLFNTTSGDVALVTKVADGGAETIECTSNIGNASPSGALWADNHVCIIIGSAYLDGATSGAPIHVVEDEKLYYCQIFRDSIKQSDRYQKTALVEGDPWTNARKQLEFEHLLGIENALFFGKASVSRDSTTGQLRTTMAGLRSLVNTNVVDCSTGTVSKTFVDKIMAEAMRQGHSGFENKELATKTGYFSMRWLQLLNQVAENKLQIVEPSEKTFGLRIAQYQGAWGVLNLLNAPVLNRSEVAGEGYVLDMEHIYPANFKGRDTKFKSNIGEVDGDYDKAEYISDKSLVVEVSPAHTRFLGLPVTAAIA